MILRIAAINHFDPSCRRRLLEWLGDARKKYGNPSFVAVEWGEEVFLRIKAQRDRFRELMQAEWPQMSDALLDSLTHSLAYEGDAHLEIYPDVEILWLDQCRQLTGAEIEGINRYAEDRFRMYRRFLGPAPDEEHALENMREAAVQEAGPPPERGDERDKRFAGLILQRIGSERDGWAIAIVGKNHASGADGSMRQLLEDLGYTCEVTNL